MAAAVKRANTYARLSAGETHCPAVARLYRVLAAGDLIRRVGPDDDARTDVNRSDRRREWDSGWRRSWHWRHRLHVILTICHLDVTSARDVTCHSHGDYLGGGVL